MKPDQTIIDASMATLAAVESRLAAATATATAAEGTASAARAALASVASRVAAGAAADPSEALDAVVAAERRAGFAANVAGSIAGERDAAETAVQKARVQAQKPVFDAGRATRLDAVTRLQTALAALSEAQADLARGAVLISSAVSAGYRRDIQIFLNDLPRAMHDNVPYSQWIDACPTVAAEQGFWGSIGA